MKSNITTLGKDPEVHLFDTEENRIVSSLRILKRDKTNPIRLRDGVGYYADNVLLEFSLPPETSIPAIVKATGRAFSQIQEDIGPRFRLHPQAAHLYAKSELRGKKCWEVGCNPSSDVYAAAKNKIVPFTDGLRTGSFHLHIGHPVAAGTNHKAKIQIVKLLDVFVGCASILFDKDETAPLRRAYYGRAGEYRPTPYGCEYRVLGNWALRTPITTTLVWDLVAHAINHFDDGEANEIIEAVGSFRVQSAINNNNRTLAKSVLEIAALPQALMDRVEKDYGSSNFYNAWGI
jgi:hypothetical protein